MATTGAGLTAASSSRNSERGGADLARRATSIISAGASLPGVSAAGQSMSASARSIDHPSWDTRVQDLTRLQLPQRQGLRPGTGLTRSNLTPASLPPKSSSAAIENLGRSVVQNDEDTVKALKSRGTGPSSSFNPGPMSDNAKTTAAIAAGASVCGIAALAGACIGGRRYYYRRKKSADPPVVA